MRRALSQLNVHWDGDFLFSTSISTFFLGISFLVLKIYTVLALKKSKIKPRKTTIKKTLYRCSSVAEI